MWGLTSLTLVATALTGCKIGDTNYVFFKKHTDSKTVFTVNDTKVSVKEAKLYLCNYKNLYGNPYDLDLWQYEEYTEDLESYVKDVTISELTRVVLMNLMAKEQGITLTEEEEAQAEACGKAYYATLTEDEQEFIGASESQVITYYKEYATAVKLYNTLTEGIDEEVSDDEARVISIQEIYVKSEEDKEAVEAALAEGNTFSSVASTYSELTTIEATVARGELPEAVENVAFDLNDGETSEAIEVDGHYYFIYCVNKYEEELTEANKSTILVQREIDQFDNRYEEYVASSEFEFNTDLWDSVTIDTGLAIETDSFFALYEEYFGED